MSGLVVDHSKDGDSQSAFIVGVLSACAFVSTVCVALRIYTRAVILKTVGADDWILIAAQVLTIGSIVIMGLEKYYGLGKHAWLITDIESYLKSFWASMLVFNAALILVKISVTLMYRRIFVTRVMRITTTSTLVFLVAWGPTTVMTLAFICVPAEKFWDLSPEGQSHCKPMLPIFLVISVTNMITDFFIFLIPLPSIKGLQLPLKQKLVLGLALCLGFFTCIVSIVRLQALPAAAKTADSSWDNVGAGMWSIIEVTVATVAACLPTLGPLASRYFPRFMGLSSRGNGGPYVYAGSKTPKSGGGSALRSRNLGDGGSTTAELANRRNHEKNPGPEDSTEELYMTNHNGQNDAEIGMSRLKFHAVTSTKAGNLDDSDSTNSDPLPIHGPVSTNIYGGNDGRITVPPTTVTKVASGHGRLKKSGGMGGGNGVIMATTVIKQEWKEQ